MSEHTCGGPTPDERKGCEACSETCGAGNVDGTRCLLVSGHDGNHYDGIGYWALEARNERQESSVSEGAEAGRRVLENTGDSLTANGLARGSIRPPWMRPGESARDALAREFGPLVRAARELDATSDEAHPVWTGRHDLYAEAQRLVSARHAKADLVDLVNWLLARLDAEKR